ncbi:MAG: sigma-70 family RNA polymerase sigma factor [Dehalococcoidia bacterium]
MTTPAATEAVPATFERRRDARVDIEVVTRAREGDPAAFETLYRLRIERVARYVGAIVRDRARTEDAVAETFLQAWRDLPKLRQPDRFDGWLLRIAYRRALAEARVRTHATLDAASTVPDERRDGSPEDSLEAALTTAEVQDALRRLPDAAREVLMLRHLGELSHREIAAQLGKSEEAARAAYSRAARDLRQLLEDGRA